MSNKAWLFTPPFCTCRISKHSIFGRRTAIETQFARFEISVPRCRCPTSHTGNQTDGRGRPNSRTVRNNTRNTGKSTRAINCAEPAIPPKTRAPPATRAALKNTVGQFSADRLIRSLVSPRTRWRGRWRHGSRRHGRRWNGSRSRRDHGSPRRSGYYHVSLRSRGKRTLNNHGRVHRLLFYDD